MCSSLSSFSGISSFERELSIFQCAEEEEEEDDDDDIKEIIDDDDDMEQRASSLQQRLQARRDMFFKEKEAGGAGTAAGAAYASRIGGSVYVVFLFVIFLRMNQNILLSIVEKK